MEIQTVFAIAIVFIAALVVASRIKESIANWFRPDSNISTCGNCAGCSSKNSQPLIQIQPLAHPTRKQ